jgi:hypothetical protein
VFPQTRFDFSALAEANLIDFSAEGVHKLGTIADEQKVKAATAFPSRSVRRNRPSDAAARRA